MRKEFFVHGAFAQIPKILALQNCNLHNLAYGNFDRNFYSCKRMPFLSFRDCSDWKIKDGKLLMTFMPSPGRT